ncbi:unnamed protein product, partial [Iphiclides podalirius]
MKARGYDRAVVATAIIGILLSTYALYVEMAAEANPDYKAFCDLSEHASCTRVLTSEFSKGFGFFWEDSSLEVPNCVYGIVFYCTIIFLSTFERPAAVHLQLFLALASVLEVVCVLSSSVFGCLCKQRCVDLSITCFSLTAVSSNVLICRAQRFRVTSPQCHQLIPRPTRMLWQLYV